MSRESNMSPIETSAMSIGYKRKDKKGFTCSNCPTLSNYTIENCFKVHGYPMNGSKKPFDNGGRGGHRGRGVRFGYGGMGNQYHANATTPG